MSESYLSDNEKRQLLELARKTIKAQAHGDDLPIVKDPKGHLAEPGAAFVTVKKKQKLRGCIGYTEAFQPLHKTVASCALAAAFQDPRFAPLSADEYPDISIEISVLTPLEKAEDPEDVIVGKHGIVISCRGQKGLLLPQVATENNWDRETFLGYTCMKAGLPPECWKSQECQLYLFEAEIFGEEEFTRD